MGGGKHKEAVTTDTKVKKTPEAVRHLHTTPPTPPPFLSPLAELKNKAGKGGWRAIARGNAGITWRIGIVAPFEAATQPGCNFHFLQGNSAVFF